MPILKAVLYLGLLLAARPTERLAGQTVIGHDMVTENRERRAVEIKAERWQSEAAAWREREAGALAALAGPWWGWVCPSTRMSVSQELHVTMMEGLDHSHHAPV